MNTAQLTPRALDVIADSGETGEIPSRTPSACSVGSVEVALLIATEDYLEAQDALDNREANGIYAEDYFVLMRRRNTARDYLDTAIAAATEGAV